MMAKISKLVLVLFSIYLGSCTGKGSIGPQDYIGWIGDPENGLIVEKEIGELVYKAKYCPYDYEILRTMKNSGEEINSDTYHTKLSSGVGSQKFVIEIKNANEEGDVLASGAKSDDEYRQRIVYLSYNVGNDIILIDGPDTLLCKLAQFEQMYKSAPYVRINAVFEMPTEQASQFQLGLRPESNDKTLIFNDVVWGNGIVKLRISADDLNNIPELEIKNNTYVSEN